MAGNKKKKEAAAARKWMMRPCTASKSTEGAAAGGHGPVTRPLPGRKGVAGSSGEQRPEGSSHLSSAAAAGEEPASLDLLKSARREGTVDKMLGEAKLPSVVPKQACANAPVAQAAAAAQGGSKFKRRLTKSEIMTIVALKPEPFPSADYLDGLAEYDRPEWIAEQKRQHEEDAAYFAKMDTEFEVFRQKVINGLKNDGYYEVDEDYLEAREKANEEAMRHPMGLWADMDPRERRLRVATPEERLLLIGDGYIPYVPDEEDEALINLGDDDFSASDEEDDFPPSDEEAGDNAHKRPHLIVSN